MLKLLLQRFFLQRKMGSIGYRPVNAKGMSDMTRKLLVMSEGQDEDMVIDEQKEKMAYGDSVAPKTFLPSQILY